MKAHERQTTTSRSERRLELPYFGQPDDVTCGPTCLRKVYAFYGLEVAFGDVLSETERNEDGGTLAVFLGNAALQRGFAVRLHSYNLRIFDPTWEGLDRNELTLRLERRAEAVRSKKLAKAIRAYRDFLDLGGIFGFDDLTASLLTGILDRGHPILTGLSSTYLYRDMRERPDDMKPDDIRGEPTGHFVVISGYRGDGEEFLVSDPWEPRGPHEGPWFPAERLIHSILLGVITYDGVLLEVWPRATDVP